FEYSRFSDGTTIFYDREEHKFFMDVQGDVEAKIKGNITAEVGENVAAKVTGDVTVEVGGQVDLSAQLDVRVTSATAIRLKAPFIFLAGRLIFTDVDGRAGDGVYWGNLTVREGFVHVQDNEVTAGTDMKAGGDVTAGNEAVSLGRHKHEGVYEGTDITDKPVGGW
ncbi:MAG: hypothetical protein LBR94_04975, partial [Desulfovibrio sp.]|nr:hypothetical protein [Desulfovibrio sp.]